MSTQASASPVRQESSFVIAHLWCECDPDTGFCGKDISALPWHVNGSVEKCLVCAELDGSACPHCGRVP